MAHSILAHSAPSLNVHLESLQQKLDQLQSVADLALCAEPGIPIAGETLHGYFWLIHDLVAQAKCSSTAIERQCTHKKAHFIH